MIVSLTPEPLNVPPRVRIDVDGEGDEFLELVVLRDGRPIRQQPAVGGLTETFTYDYEAPFGRPVTYSVTGKTADWVEVFSEDWSDLSEWYEIFLPAASGGWLTSGWVYRDDVVPSSGAFRIVFEDETFLDPNGIGYVGVDAAWATLGGGGTQLRLLASSDLAAPVDAGNPVVLEFSNDRSTVTLSQGTSRISTAALPSGPRLSARGPVGGFSVEVPGAVNDVSDVKATTLNVDAAYLIHPVTPTLSTPIETFTTGGDIRVADTTDQTRTHAARQAVYQPDGRREAVAYPLGPRSAGAWTLVLNTHTLDARNRVMQLLDDQAPLLLRSPADAGWDLPDGWYAVGDVESSRPVNIAGHQWRQITLPLTRVAEPPVQLAPPLTWGDLKLRGFTWGDLLNGGFTWHDILMGEI